MSSMNGASVVAVATFVVVFLAVCAVAWVMLARRGRSESVPPGPRQPSKIAVAAVLVTMTVVTLLAVAAFAKVSLWILDPVLDPVARVVAGWFFVIFLRPQGAALLGVLALVAGLPFAKRFRRPSRFKTGVVLVALALGTFWPLQYLASRFAFPFWEWKAALHILAVFLSITLLSAGLEAMRRANNTAEDDSWEFWQ